MNKKSATDRPSLFARISAFATRSWAYFNEGVWTDQRKSWKIDIVKILNLTLRSMTSADLQTRACAMTYRTILAVVPAFALLFAIGRGFGFQNLLQTQLFNHLPAQQHALEAAFSFVDSYLAQASEGIFVGVGIIFLLWTLISLMSDVETSFNSVWGVTDQRTMWRKMTDYTAILLILPIMMICSAGIQLFMSSTLQRLLPFDFLSPLLGVGLDILAFLFSCLFFAGSYMLIPNTKVKPLNAIVSGSLAAVAFNILQWLFVTGQMYVTKYNAIYGSFSFLPLFMIWLQLVWMITLMGAVICYASQNTFRFSFERQIDNIAPLYRRKVSLAVLAIIARRFADSRPPLSPEQICGAYHLPPRLIDSVVATLVAAGYINRVAIKGARPEDLPLQPATELSTVSVASIIDRLATLGDSDFIPGFDTRFPAIDAIVDRIHRRHIMQIDNLTLGQVDINIDPYNDFTQTNPSLK